MATSAPVSAGRAALCAAALALGACGGSSDAAAPAGQAAAAPRVPERRAPSEAQIPLGSAAHLRALALALEAGERAEAGRLALALSPKDGLDYHLLRARWLALEGDEIECARELESARAKYPAQGRVYAAAAELHALAGRLETAAAELAAAERAVGATPELERARALVCLCQTRSVNEGWRILCKLAEEAPDLPFSKRPLSQAHWLVGKQLLQAGDRAGAAACAKAGLEAWPGDRDLLELEADVASAAGDFAGAAERYEQLLAAGVDCAGTLASLHQRASTAALVQSDRAAAVEHARRARALGLGPEELGFGLDLIAEDAAERGFAAYAAEDWPAAAEAFGEALGSGERAGLGALEQAELENLLAKALFRLSHAGEACEHFAAALALLEDSAIPLPEPIHLNYARALVFAGRGDEVRAGLERYLEREPDGAWVADTRAMLAELSGE